jgi:hypothetical protein
MLGLSLDFGIWIRDALSGHQGVAHRIMITLRFRVRHWREIRRIKLEILTGFKGEVYLNKRSLF